MLDAELKSKINQLWDKFWSGGISNPLQAIEQISYLMFMKRLEDEDNQKLQMARMTDKNYTSVFEKNEDCRWSHWTNLTGDEMLWHVRDRVFPFLRNLGDEDSLYRQYMKDATFIIPTAGLLIEAVNTINEMKIKEQNRDTKGDLYEYLLSELRTSGKNGQFRTPRHIIKMMVEIADPKIGEKICDPACGTAGFLVNAYEHIIKDNTSKDLIKVDEKGKEYNFKGDKLSIKQWKILKEESIYGFDFDQTMVRIALMNLMMHNIKNPNIKQMNTLSTRYHESKMYDVILANPPFKGSLDESEISDVLTIKTKKTEILFLEQMYNLMRIGSRTAVIVPDGVLFGSSKAHREMQKKLIEECRLDAIISMPSGVFKPYAGVSTAVLYFTKGEPTEKVWFYNMESDGFTLDDKRTFIDGKGDIPDIIKKFRNRYNLDMSDRTAKCFFVDVQEIRDNNYDLSISKYQEIEYEEVEYEHPAVIKEKIIELEEQIIETIQNIDIKIQH